MEYFGTNMDTPGHYRWNITKYGLQERSLRFDDLPFHPESLTNRLKKGEHSFYQGGGYTVIAFAGSPADNRGGTMSVFWVKEVILHEEMLQRINDNAISKAIVENIIKLMSN